MKKIFLVFSIISIMGCTDSDVECTISDHAKILDRMVISEKDYFLVLKTTGYSDKVQFLELYDSKPDFDMCGKNAVEPLDVIVLGNESIGSVAILGSKLQIVEINNEAGFSINEIKFSRDGT